jgi:acyl-CoA synthetase (NDP forming)
MDPFFNPHSLAVVGVSESPENLGRRIAQNLQEFDYKGIVYLVGPKGGTAFGRRIYKSVADIPDAVDLAVLLIPARYVPAVLEECGQKGIRWAVIESAGFSEHGPEGEALEAQVVKVAGKYGIRFIGPNCIGTINLPNGLITSFASLKNVFSHGNISIISQSGGVGLDYLNILASEGLGLAKFASIGNKLNVDECDLLEYLIEDEQTGIIIVYLESIPDGRRLMQIARRTSKPILLHKSNVGRLAREIAQSHTASLSTDDAVVSAALKQVGIARFADTDTLVNCLKVLHLPPMEGDRVGVLSRSGGHAVIAADACEQAGFVLNNFPEPFLKEIEKHFRAKVIRLTNPLDLGDLFDFNVYTRITDETLKLPDVDGVIFLHEYMSAVERESSRAFLSKIEELSYAHKKPVATSVITDGEEMSVLRKTLPHPVFTAPEDAVFALAMHRDFKHEARPEPALPDVPMDLARIEKILAGCRSAGRSPLVDEGLEILQAAGIRVPESTLVGSADEAAAAAAEYRRPVALKLVSAQAFHKTDVGGVKLGLAEPEDIRRAFEELSAVDRGGRVLVQPMVAGGLELILGARRDPSFGTVVLVGLGGIFVEVLRDVSMRVVPFHPDQLREMIEDLSAYPLLAGVRGQPPRDISAVHDGLLALARLMEGFDQIQELDVNPLMVLPEGQGVFAVDARLVLGAE